MKSKFSYFLIPVLLVLGLYNISHSGLNDGLVAYYPFNGNAKDESGNGKDGIRYGATPTSDKFGNQNSAYYFDGISNYIVTPPLGIITNSSFTVSYWMKFEWQEHRIWTLYFGNFHALINTDSAYGFSRGIVQNGIFDGIQNQFNIAQNQGVWTHIATIYDAYAATLTTYVNAVPIDSRSLSSYPMNDNGLYVGKPNSGWPGNSYYKGSIDEVRIYNRALSPYEIQLLYGSGLDLPIDYWSTSNFYTASLGSDRSGGRVNSWFDHKSPTYRSDPDPKLYRGWDGQEFSNADLNSCQLGVSCYNGHNGIDFSRRINNEQIYAAAPGTVLNTSTNPLVKSSYNGDSRWGGYGSRVWIDHHNGYATLYGHLDQVLVEAGQEIISPREPLGIMGNTGLSHGTHLHFGVYYNPNYFNPNFTGWTATDVVDPYGCFGSWCNNDHPWNAPGGWLWKYPPVCSSTLGVSGGTMSSNTGSINISIPQGAVSGPTLFELLDIPTFAQPTSNYRSVGRSFWLRQGQSLMNMTGRSLTKTLGDFAQPITIEISYTDESVLHINESQLVIYYYDEATGSWLSLPTVVDTNLNKATAQTTFLGRFDLQGPPLCPGDTQEPNDNYNAALTISVNSPPSVNLFDIFQDEDWFRFYSLAGSRNVIETLNLSPGVDTILDLYGVDGFTLLTSNDNHDPGLASYIDWKAPYEGTYFIRVFQAPGSSFGCSSSYEIKVTQTNYIYLPVILR